MRLVALTCFGLAVLFFATSSHCWAKEKVSFNQKGPVQKAPARKDKVRSPQSENEYEVNAMDPEVDLDSLKGEYKVNSYESLQPGPSIVPARESREAAFKAAGLVDAVRNLDELDRDLLYMRTRSIGPEETAKKFPDFTVEQLKRLERAIQETR